MPGCPRRGRRLRVWSREVHVHDVGQGAPALLLHGCGGLGEEALAPFPERPELRWVAPDRPGYGFSAPVEGCADPRVLARWALALLDALGIERAQVVSHSIAAATALCMAQAAPARVARLVLLAPFCRPTPQRAMPGLRLAVAPLVGRAIRERVLPRLAPLIAPRRIAAFAYPHRPPPWLAALPHAHLMRPEAIAAAAAELRAFNAAVAAVGRSIRVETSAVALVGARDGTARSAWHVPWLRARVPQLELVVLQGVGHALHHVAPAVAMRAILAGVEAAAPEPGRDAAHVWAQDLWRHAV